MRKWTLFPRQIMRNITPGILQFTITYIIFCTDYLSLSFLRFLLVHCLQINLLYVYTPVVRSMMKFLSIKQRINFPQLGLTDLVINICYILLNSDIHIVYLITIRWFTDLVFALIRYTKENI